MSESVKYTYDKNGNLLRENAARYRKDYVYNAQNRMSFSDVQDSVLNTRNFTEYAYDAFGRRIETKEYLGDYTRNLYDGFSFDVLGKSVLQASYPMALSEQKYRDARTGHPATPDRHPELVSGSAPNGRNAAGTDIGTRYRYIDETPLVPLTEAGKANNTNAASSASGAKTRSRPNNEYVLYSYGEPVAISADGNASYFGTDILGSVRSVTDKYGTVQSSYDYDAFGSPYLGNLENDIGFGYCGKVYDNGTGLYDYGFRDYSPNNARFTTIDPIRDGSNWFSYVVNDPVNYVDPLGLEDSPLEEFFNPAKEFIENLFTGEVVNKTNSDIYGRTENEKKGGANEPFWDPNLVIIQKDSTLTKSVKDSIPIDGLVLPDGSIYKGWSGSKVMVTEQNGTYSVKQSFGTTIINSVLNVGKFIINIFLPSDQKQEYYRYYTKSEVEASPKAKNSIKGWDDSIQTYDSNYFRENTNSRGCTK